MQNRTGVMLFAGVILILCTYYLSFTFKAGSINRAATEYAKGAKDTIDTKKKKKYLDSLMNSEEPVYNLLIDQFTYKQVKEKELALGLDLQGGMHVTLEVSPVDIINALAANKANDPDLKKAILQATERQQNSQENFVDLFASAFEGVAPDKELNKVFTNTTTRGKIDFNSSNADIIKVIRDEVKDAFDRTFNIIRTRIDKFGVANPNIQKLAGSNRILVELPGVDDPERVRSLLTGVAKLEFWEVWLINEFAPYYQEFAAYIGREAQKEAVKNGTNQNIQVDSSEVTGDNPLIAEEENSDNPLVVEENPLIAEEENDDSTNTDTNPLIVEGEDDTTNVATNEGDSTGTDSTSTTAEADSAKVDSTQIAAQLAAQILQPFNYGFQVKVTDTVKINEYLSRSEVKSLFPSNLKFLWDVKPDPENAFIALYAIKKGRGGKAPLDGEVVVDARTDFDQGEAVVSMQMNATGAKKWKKLTGSNVGRPVAIVLDNYVYSAPIVNGEIPNGSSQISGNFTVEEATDLANVLKAGKLPASPRIVEEATVGPSLGQESISQGLMSMIIGLGLVMIFMVLYYKSSGLIADVALFVNIFFIVGILAQLGAVLTLAGMAGIVLTIGMSVDANVLIYERIREELKNKKTLKSAIKLGYEKAYSSIIDANVTTFLTGAILYTFGSGGVKGFAVTLMIGIVCSLFSAIFITRLIIETFVRKETSKSVSFDSFLFKDPFQNITVDFVGLRKKAYIFSGSIITIGLVLLIIKGLTLGVDFQGGRSYVVKFDAPVSVKEARAEVDKVLDGSTEVKTFGGNNKLKITTSFLIKDESPEADKKVEATLLQGLEAFKERSPEIISFSKVGATIADDIANTSYLAVSFSLLVIFLYIFLRFQKWQYGLGALAALIHDVLIVISFMAFAKLLGLSYEVDQVFIAAMLTVVGYSINDTVVVFDRIREFAGNTESSKFPEELNIAVNNTLSRTVMTSSTTLVVVLTLFLFGGQVLSGFSYALLIGVLIGTYSSVFIASPIVLDISLMLQNMKNRAKEITKAKK